MYKWDANSLSDVYNLSIVKQVSSVCKQYLLKHCNNQTELKSCRLVGKSMVGEQIWRACKEFKCLFLIVNNIITFIFYHR